MIFKVAVQSCSHANSLKLFEVVVAFVSCCVREHYPRMDLAINLSQDNSVRHAPAEVAAPF